jgi:hypothetical protein
MRRQGEAGTLGRGETENNEDKEAVIGISNYLYPLCLCVSVA